MRALIVDDEPVARRILREELEALSVEIAGEAENGETALLQIVSCKPDIVFLDIQMPLMNGFQVLAQLPVNLMPSVVMTTAYDQHAIQAFEAGAIDYLLKPISQKRLAQAVERSRRTASKAAQSAQQLEYLQKVGSTAVREPLSIQKIVGKAGRAYHLLNLSEVLAFQAEGDLTWIVTARQRYLASENLSALEKRLTNSFFRRVHRNALINTDHIRKMSVITSQRWLLTLQNGIEFIVSKRRAKNIRDLLNC